MNLHSVFAEIHPDWYRQADMAGEDAGAIEGDLLLRACDSALGRRMLARWLMRDIGGELFSPRPDGAVAATVVRWPRPRLAALSRDLGALAFAPAIRAEVRREPVRQLKRALGNSYLLALDKQVWDGRCEPAAATRLQAELAVALAAGQDDAVLHGLLERRGRSELHAWAALRDPGLAEWLILQYPRAARLQTHLPEQQVLFLHDHHLARARAS
jgi:hypothetical protein